MHLAELTWSDEAHFHLDGGVNRHNCLYWAPENPQWVVEQSLHSPRTTAWAAIWQGGVYGPFFFDGTVNKERYLQMLQKEFWPVVVAEEGPTRSSSCRTERRRTGALRCASG